MRKIKSQINPHFLLLRYVLDDCEADHVPISGEIKYDGPKIHKIDYPDLLNRLNKGKMR